MTFNITETNITVVTCAEWSTWKWESWKIWKDQHWDPQWSEKRSITRTRADPSIESEDSLIAGQTGIKPSQSEGGSWFHQSRHLCVGFTKHLLWSNPPSCFLSHSDNMDVLHLWCLIMDDNILLCHGGSPLRDSSRTFSLPTCQLSQQTQLWPRPPGEPGHPALQTSEVQNMVVFCLLWHSSSVLCLQGAEGHGSAGLHPDRPVRLHVSHPEGDQWDDANVAAELWRNSPGLDKRPVYHQKTLNRTDGLWSQDGESPPWTFWVWNEKEGFISIQKTELYW